MPTTYAPIIGNYEKEKFYTHEEFMNELAKQLGQAYGLNDIREVKILPTKGQVMGK